MALLASVVIRPGAGTSAPIDITGATLLVAILAGWPSTPGITDSEGHTWALLTDRQGPDGGGRLAYVEAPTTSATYTFTIAGGGFQAAILLAFDEATTFESDASAIINAMAGQAGTVTPANPQALIVSAMVAWNAGGSGAVDSGLSLDERHTGGTAAMGVAIGHLFQSPGAAIDPEWSVTGGTVQTAHTAAFTASFGPAAIEATIDQAPIEYAIPVETEGTIDQAVAEYAASPTIEAVVDQYVIEYIPGSGGPGPPPPGPPGCPPNFPVEPGSGDPACAPSPIIP